MSAHSLKGRLAVLTNGKVCSIIVNGNKKTPATCACVYTHTHTSDRTDAGNI